MAVPETAMNENNPSSLAKYEIGRSRQILCMEGVTIAQPMNDASYSQLRGRVLPAHEAHATAAFGGAQCVRHFMVKIA